MVNKSIQTGVATINNSKRHYSGTIHIIIPDLNEGGITGNEFLEANKAILNFEDRKLQIKTGEKLLETQFSNKKEESAPYLSSIHTIITTEPENNT